MRPGVVISHTDKLDLCENESQLSARTINTKISYAIWQQNTYHNQELATFYDWKSLINTQKHHTPDAKPIGIGQAGLLSAT